MSTQTDILSRVVSAGTRAGTDEAQAYDAEGKVVCSFTEFHRIVAENSTAYAQVCYAQSRPVIGHGWWVLTPELVCLTKDLPAKIERVEGKGPFSIAVGGTEYRLKHEWTVNDLSRLAEYWPHFGVE